MQNKSYQQKKYIGNICDPSVMSPTIVSPSSPDIRSVLCPSSLISSHTDLISKQIPDKRKNHFVCYYLWPYTTLYRELPVYGKSDAEWVSIFSYQETWSYFSSAFLISPDRFQTHTKLSVIWPLFGSFVWCDIETELHCLLNWSWYATISMISVQMYYYSQPDKRN